MPYPETVSMPRPCPDCGGKLLRKTVDQEEPLGMVACSNCPFTSPIDGYAKSVRMAIMAKAQERKAQG